MPTAADRPKSPFRGRRLPEVTPEEIAITERILQSIDLNNQILASVSQWVLVWQNVRDLSFRIEASTKETQKTVAASFRKLLNGSIGMGDKLVDLVDTLGISAEHLSFATGCSRKSIVSCISFLRETLQSHYGKPVSLDLVREVWAEFSGEPNPVV